MMAWISDGSEYSVTPKSRIGFFVLSLSSKKSCNLKAKVLRIEGA